MKIAKVKEQGKTNRCQANQSKYALEMACMEFQCREAECARQHQFQMLEKQVELEHLRLQGHGTCSSSSHPWSFRRYNASIDSGSLWMEFQNEFGDDAKVAASSSETEEEVWVFGVAVRMSPLAVTTVAYCTLS
jgi:hypothetical protein